MTPAGSEERPPKLSSSADLLDSPAAGGAAIRGSAIRLAGYTLGVLAGIVAMALLFRHLGVEDAGRYVTVMALVGIFAGLTDGGLATIAVRELTSKVGEERDRFIRTLLAVRVASTSLGIVLGTAFAGAVGYGRTLVVGTALAGIGLVLFMTQQTLTAPLMKDLRWGWVAALDLVRQVAAAAVIVGLVAVGASLLPFFTVSIAAGAIVLVATALIVRGDAPVLPSFALGGWWRLVRDALPFALAIAVGTIYFRISVIVVSLLSTARETGYFGASYRIIEVLLAVPQLAIGAAFPILARTANTDRARFSYGLRRLFDASLVFGGWVALCLVLGASLAIDIVAGPDFDRAVPVLQIQGVAMLASFVAALWGFALLGLRRHRDLVVMSLAPLIVTGILATVLTLAYGARGAAVATAVGELTMALVGGILVARAAGFSPVSPGIVPRVALAWGAAAAVWLIPGLPVAPRVAIASAVYFAALFLLRAIPKELLVELRRPKPSAAR